MQASCSSRCSPASTAPRIALHCSPRVHPRGLTLATAPHPASPYVTRAATYPGGGGGAQFDAPGVTPGEGGAHLPNSSPQAQAEAVQQTFMQLGRQRDWVGTLQGALAWTLASTGHLLSWVRSCGEVLPNFSRPSPRQALYRMGLVLAASLMMIVVVSTIDGLLLQLYVAGARRFV